MRSAFMVPALITSAVTMPPVKKVRQSHCPSEVRPDASRWPRPLTLIAHMSETALTGKPVSVFRGTLLQISPSSNVST